MLLNSFRSRIRAETFHPRSDPSTNIAAICAKASRASRLGNFHIRSFRTCAFGISEERRYLLKQHYYLPIPDESDMRFDMKRAELAGVNISGTRCLRS